jgi:hypothetical protein
MADFRLGHLQSTIGHRKLINGFLGVLRASAVKLRRVSVAILHLDGQTDWQGNEKECGEI